MTILIENLKFLCARTGLSQNRLAQILGIPQSTISRTLAGKTIPRAELVVKLAEVFTVDPVALQMRPLSEDAPYSVTWADATRVQRTIPRDYFIRERDLNNHAKLLEYKAKMAHSHHLMPRVDGSIILIMPTDELDPIVPRGAIVYITVEEDQFEPDTSNGAEAIGVIGSTEDGFGPIAIGNLSIVQGKMFITPTNPRMKDLSVEVCRVTARIAGWTVARDAQARRSLRAFFDNAPCSPAGS